MSPRLLVLMLVCLLAPSPAAAEPEDRATAFALADIRPAAEASVLKATQLLLGPTPGVLTTRIPGGQAVSLTATGVDPDTGVFTFVAEGASVADVQALVADLSAAAGSGAPGLPLGGMINGQAVQLVVLGALQGPGGTGSLRLLVAFD